jgi:hypothetical protein
MGRRRRVLCCAVLVVGLDTLVPVAQIREAMAVSGVTVIDTINGRAIPNSTVTIRDGIITSVTPGGAPPNGAPGLVSR